MKALFMLATALFAFASTIVTVPMVFNILTLNSFGITESILETIDSREIQPAGDPVDDPVAPM